MATKDRIRLVTLNIQQGGGPRIHAICDFLLGTDADVLVITEFRSGKRGRELLEALAKHGYGQHAGGSAVEGQHGIVIASRIPLDQIDGAAGPLGSEHCLVIARVADFCLIGAYFPQGKAKREVFDCVLGHLRRVGTDVLVMGDLNTGKHFEDEAGKTFACVQSFLALEAAGLVDAWRSRNTEAREYSWFSYKGNGFRIDHALCTASINDRVTKVVYLPDSRVHGITDHAALMLEIRR